ncbi:hypothetical protein C8F04DRAFT_1239654 [Mycena alexandri]|uniref:Uncharacterized protein n=1 Tax=Mycena alexandri TaxID=1745969 RepID=A0AAD6SAT4_9AGAR|nr:hypothetical protein C8F04DRAFT_1239654 [Mycena alexandri]
MVNKTRGAAPSSARGRARGSTRGRPATTRGQSPAPKKQKQGASTTPADATVDDDITPSRSHLDRTKKGKLYAEAENILPRAKRTSAAVQAEADALAETRADLARQHMEAIAKVAELTAAQDKLAVEEEKNRVFTLEDDYESGDEPSANKNEPVLHICQEDFDRIEDDDEYRSTDEFVIAKPKKNTSKKKTLKKPAKGETRATVDAAVAVLGEADKVVKRKGVQNADAAGASAKAGVSKRWAASSKTPQVSPPTSPKLGGLDDDAAAATRPTADVPKTVRANKMVTIDVPDDSDDDTPYPVKAPRKVQRMKMEPTATAPKLPALRVKATPKPGIKTESSGTFNFTPPSHADVKNLPAFIAPTWSSKFLPAAYRALSKVAKPMSFATAADAEVTVNVLQEVLDEEYSSGYGWKIVWGDAICTKAVARLGERRGLFGRSGLTAVDDQFMLTRHFGALDAPEAERGTRLLDIIQADARYALRFNGPAFFKNPTPEHHTLRPKDEGYIRPTGFLESRPFIATVRPYIKGAFYKMVLTPSGGVDLEKSDLPVGALVMGAISVERGYKLHLTGDRLQNAIPDFSVSVYSNAAAGYLKSIRKMSANRWESILKACHASTTDEEPAASPSGLDTLDGAREEMYCPSSPPAI